MNYLINPNLPSGKVKLCLIGASCIDEIRELNSFGIECITLKPCDFLPEEINYHADMLAFHMGNGEIIASFDSIGESNNILIRNTVHLGNKYPEDVLLNAALIGNKLICNTKTVSKHINSFAIDNNIEIIHINQGYSKCSICIVNDNAIITDDPGISTLLKNYQIDVLTISKGNIYLSDNHYGFIGGASGKIAEDIIYFSGNLEMHEDYTRIIDFLKFHNIHAVYNKKRILRDFGGFIPLTQY